MDVWTVGFVLMEDADESVRSASGKAMTTALIGGKGESMCTFKCKRL